MSSGKNKNKTILFSEFSFRIVWGFYLARIGLGLKDDLMSDEVQLPT